MQELPILKFRVLMSLLGGLGFEVVSQRGSHVKLRKTVRGNIFVVIVPRHSEIRRGTLLSIIRQAGLDKDEFIELLGKR